MRWSAQRPPPTISLRAKRVCMLRYRPQRRLIICQSKASQLEISIRLATHEVKNEPIV